MFIRNTHTCDSRVKEAIGEKLSKARKQEGKNYKKVSDEKMSEWTNSVKKVGWEQLNFGALQDT